MNYVLGFDLGTSSCKAIIYDENLNPVSHASQEYPTFFPESGWAQQPANQWWDAFCNTVKSCLASGKVKPEDIVSVGIDSMGSIPLPIDKDGNPLYDGLLWMDRRSVGECPLIEARLDNRLFDITGNRNDPSNIAPKILWFKNNYPDIYNNTYKFLHANGYLVYKLTGNTSIDITECGLTQLYDMRAGIWSDEIFKALEIDQSKMPDIFKCSDHVGKITKEAADQCGLCEGTVVIAGAMDCLASALGTSSSKMGEVYIAGGTVSAVGIVMDEVRPNKALHFHNHIIPGKYVCVSGVDFGGGGLRWFRDVMGETDYVNFNQIAALAPAGNDGLVFIPYMVGQRSPLYNNNTTGVAFGMTPEHGKQHLVRMFMEGTSYAVRNILEYFRVAGNTPLRAKLTGGISNSEVWSQILCDVIGIDIEFPGAYDVATLGSAMTAAVAVGLYPSYDEVIKCTKVQKKLTPNPQNKEVYNRTFSIFKNVFNNLLFSYEYASNLLSGDL